MIRDAASQVQVDAAHPMQSTWLSANAGSGKTRVLTDRVARLLLAGVPPLHILCLTYTKAAAAEMQNRLFKRLGSWAMLDDDALTKDLQDLGAEVTLNAESLSRARTLFASAIETPGGLKIQTIHSFCASILRRFPLEAQVSPQFREMEDRTAVLLRGEVLDDIALGPNAQILRDLLQFFTGAELDKMIGEIAGKRHMFSAKIQDATLRAALDIHDDLTEGTLIDELLGPHATDTIRDVMMICQKGSVTDQKAADKLSGINFDNASLRDLETLESVFLFGKTAAAAFGPKIGKFPTKKLQDNHPDIIASLNPLMEAVADARPDRQALQALARSYALHAFGQIFVQAYTARKQALGLLDFDDLIGKARQLLTDPRVAQWVLFRLDGGIDHVLVDEAQDTSPDQWAVIEHLTKEFASGIGAKADARRTIFVVGDKKQSIYSFQGADPAAFDEMQHYFADALAQVEDRLHNQELRHSFRSSLAVLRVVDTTFDGPLAKALGHGSQHIAFKDNMPGRVDLWPAIAKAEKEENDRAWNDPVDEIGDTHHDVILAEQIADDIFRMTKSETIPVEIGNSNTYNHRPVTEGDVLILVQRRSDLFSEIIRACKAKGLKIAGADRLRVGAELAVKDLAALLRFLALPEDDLSLACTLKSPLFGWSEQNLYSLAQSRPQKSYLWAALRNHPDHPITLGILNDLRKQSDFLRPYDLLERILIRHNGRANLIARLGAEAEDGIDALLAQAMSYETEEVPSLTGFLTWMDTDDLEIKRQMEGQGDRIRVMTVHGAKGLEAPIVYLPDTAKRNVTINTEVFRDGETALWKTNVDEMPPAMAALRNDMIAAQERERLRLLYVAMTRAEKWLIVCGAGEVGDEGESWYMQMADGIERAGAVDTNAGPLVVRRVGHGNWQSGVIEDLKTASVPQSAPVDIQDLPAIAPLKTVAPSDLGGDKILMGDPAGANQDEALARGRLMHLLLEHLPAVDPGSRQMVAKRLVAASPDDLVDDLSDALADDAIALLNHADLRAVLTGEALAEVALTAPLPSLGGVRMHGAIDRLIVDDNMVTAVDFKTNRLVPDTPDTVPEGLLRQMGAYAEALAQIYPDHIIQTAILWTQNGQLMELPAQLVDAALRRATIP